MDNDTRTALLFQYASGYRFQEFDTLFDEIVPGLSPRERTDAYGMRAQIKLYASADTLLNDLQCACQSGEPPLHPSLSEKWMPDSANRFIVFSRVPGAVSRLYDTLAQAGGYLDRLYGASGAAMARQVRSEILYFRGEFEEAIRTAREQLNAIAPNTAASILALYVMLRSYLASGESGGVEQCILDIVRASKASPECLAPYQVVRSWANLTTGWSGDTPRFRMEPRADDEPQPVLDDRLEAIRSGIARLSESEKPFAAYAGHSYANVCVMRDYFMDVFNAIYWNLSGDPEKAGAFFAKAYRIAIDSGLLMPIVEYGGQIIPLLERARGDARYSAQWLDRAVALAEQYEAGLHAFRT